MFNNVPACLIVRKNTRMGCFLRVGDRAAGAANRDGTGMGMGSSPGSV
jgi:hypothetical protein